MNAFDRLSVYVRTSEILKEHLPSGLYAEDFSQQHTDILSSELSQHFQFDHLIACKDELRRAIKEHFLDTHDELIVIFHNNNEIIIREKNSMDKKKLNRLILLSIKKFLTYDKHPFITEKDSAILKLSEMKIKSFRKTLNVSNKKLFKKIMKESTKRFLHLNDEDQLICLNNSLFVKKSTDNITERRLFAIPSNEFEKIKDKYFNDDLFPKIENKLFLAFDDNLDFRKLSNNKFSTIYIKSFHNLIYGVVEPILIDEDEAVIKHFTNFMLRKHFDEMMISCAQELSRHTLDHNMNAEKFLLYYNGGLITSKDRQTYIKPLILHSNGNEYELHELFSIIKRYEIILSKVKHQKKLIELAEFNIEEVQKQKSTLELRQREHVNKLAQFEKESNKAIEVIARRKEHRHSINKRLLSVEELSIIKRKDSLGSQSETLNSAIKKYKKDRIRVKFELKTELSKALIIDNELTPLSHDYYEAIRAIARAMAKKPEPVKKDSRHTILKK